MNHIIDPTYFFDAIDSFSNDYDIYIKSDVKLDDYGKQIISYKKELFRGSIQPEGIEWRRSKSGNTKGVAYNFYCKSIYRINIGDFIHYNNSWLICTSINPFDEYGCRSGKLEITSLSQHRDLKEFIDVKEGMKLV